MRIKENNSNSIANIVFTYFAIILLFITIFSVLSITLFTRFLLRYDIQGKMDTLCHDNMKYITLTNGELHINEGQMAEHANPVIQLVLSEDGEILSGEYPESYFQKMELSLGKVKEIRGIKNHYYLSDMVIKVHDLKQIESFRTLYIRNFVPASHYRNEYKRFLYYNYAGMFFVILLCGLVIYGMMQTIQKPLNELCDMAEGIVDSQDLSKRIVIEKNSLDEIKALAAANNRILDKVEELVETQKRFSSDVAHELKTPVSVILAECQYTSKYVDNREDMIKSLEVIHQQARKTSDFIDQIFRLTRLEKNQVHLNYDEIDVEEMLRGICENEPLIREKNLQVMFDIEACKMKLDFDLILIAFRNIINNAAKYSEEKKQITIRTKAFQDYYHIIFQDQGCGMEDEEMRYIFQHFYRADESRSTEGLGLGLSIVDNIVRLHQGRILVTSEKGVGSIFTVELPYL